MSEENLQKLISLTFDEDPEIRKQAAQSISKIDDPGAMFALFELSYDKDLSVKELAQKLLDKRKSKEPELMSFSEIFKKSEDKGKKEIIDEEKRKRILDPIEKMFEKKLGKDKAEIVKKKMMPSLEKVYLKSVGKKSKKKSEKVDTERKVALQEFLTTYLDAMYDVNEPGELEVHPDAGAVEVSEPRLINEEEIEETEELEPVLELESVTSTTLDPGQIEKLKHELDSITASPEKPELKELDSLPDSTFKKAYEIMMFCEGDEAVMKKEMKRMLKNTEKDIRLAFKLARDR
ncbi:hypothetical protein JXB01_04655, partial [Candidatus Micrarchaeota archaeon]|nr:hypothetical protein [Candidatus Micrarchaeota archaeon]